MRADRLYFNKDGTIQKVLPTLRGVGTADAFSKIQVDRASYLGPGNPKVEFLSPARKQDGWKVTLPAPGARIQYNDVDFGSGKARAVRMKAASPKGGTIEIRLNEFFGPIIARVKIPGSLKMTVFESGLTREASAIHDLVFCHEGGSPVAIDWVEFTASPVQAGK